jgi:hypothetical protein
MPTRPAPRALDRSPRDIGQAGQPPTGYGQAVGDGEPGVLQVAGAVTVDSARAALPRRTRGASLSPRLRLRPDAVSADEKDAVSADEKEDQPPAPPTALEPSARSPEEAASLMSALQDGWDRARTENFDYFDGGDQR